MAIEVVATNSETNTNTTYDVFLSFRGDDTRLTFTGHLYDALRRKGINTFIDDEKLRIGETIRHSLLEAIEGSKISIVVLSANYASSTWCLDELVKIMECHEKRNQLVFPIFYRVEPSDVRHLKNSYEMAMAAHENTFGCDSEKVHKWKSALKGVSNLAGSHLNGGYEFKFIEDIVSKAIAQAYAKPLHIEEPVVGLEHEVALVKLLLEIKSYNKTLMLGILGTGGIGKTTLAKALYNTIYKQFDGACFLSDVRKTSYHDRGIVRLQQTLLSEVLKEGTIKLGSVERGISMIKERLRTKRVLIVLDDVDRIEQLKELAGGCNWFGGGSRIIITTRDRHLLTAHPVKKIHTVGLLSKDESSELFCQNAFKTNHVPANYEDLCDRALRYAKGLPLALKVISSNLIDKDLNEWKSALDKYENNLHSDIHSILRVSYDSLERNEREIFLDIACFFNGQRLEYVKKILGGCGFYTDDGIRILVDKSLITVEDGYLRMHDLIQDMGREIIKEEAPKEASERSRLWLSEDVLEVLTENPGNSKIEGIKFECGEEEVNCVVTAFEEMNKLRILIVRNKSISPSKPITLPNRLRLLDWKGYPLKSFPASAYSNKIAAINLSFSSLVLEKPFQQFDHLTYMNFSGCQSITKFPNVSGAKNLRELILNRCRNLVEVDLSVGFLPNLVSLNASNCNKIKTFLPKMNLPSLQYLSFDGCKRLSHFPNVVENMPEPLKICMKNTAIKELPDSFCLLVGLRHLDMTSCKELQNLASNSFSMMPNVTTLKIGGCPQLGESLTRFKGMIFSIAGCWPNLETLHFSNASLSAEDLVVIMHSFPNLKDLNVASNYVVSFPACIKESNCLTCLDVSYCLNLQEIPELPSCVRKVDARHCNSLTAETSSMLWSQVAKEINRLEVVMPKTEIPECLLDNKEEGSNPTFWARGKFPIVALALVFDKMKYQAVGLHLFIDGEHVPIRYQQYHNFYVEEDHVLLCDLRVLFSDEEWKRLDELVGNDNDWKRVQVKCETGVIISHWGVYVYKNESNYSDIQFKRQYPESSESLSFSPYTDSITITGDEDEEGSVTSTSGHVKCSEHFNRLLVDLNRSTQTTCNYCCSPILSTFKKLICCMVRRRRKMLRMQESPMGCMQESLMSPMSRCSSKEEEEEEEEEDDDDDDDDDDNVDIDEEQVVRPSIFSESLQTVVDNLKRVMAPPRQEKHSCSELLEDDDYSDDEY